MGHHYTDLKNCPACADSRMSLQEHSGWYWVTCATCHYRGPAMRDVVSAVAEYNAQRDIIAQYLVSRSGLAAVTAERDAHLAAIRSTFGVLAARGYDDDNAPLQTDVRRVLDYLDRATTERDALKKRVADAERVVALGYVEHSAGKFFLPSHGVDKYGTYALVRLEDGE